MQLFNHYTTGISDNKLTEMDRKLDKEIMYLNSCACVLIIVIDIIDIFIYKFSLYLYFCKYITVNQQKQHIITKFLLEQYTFLSILI